MLVLLSYAAIAAAFFLACMVEIHRTRSRAPRPHDHDSADRIILHLVALVAALLWVVTLPFLLRIGLRRLRPRRAVADAQARIAARIASRRARLAS